MSSSTNPLALTLLFGGTSAEHEISLRSARAVFEHLDKRKYEIRLQGISREGSWLSAEDSAKLLEGQSVQASMRPPYLPTDTDVVFPILHGPMGEDGTVQGWLELMEVPFVGSGCLGSALAMDKSVAKHVLRSADIPVLPWTDVRFAQWQANPEDVLDLVERKRHFPCFVKPTCLGSSVGISRVENRADLHDALVLAFRFGDSVLVEPAIQAREFEVAILDGVPPLASLPGEICTEGWYDYDAKYTKDDAELHVPADSIPPRMADGMRDLALQAFRVLRLRGLARVDFLLDQNTGRFALNEVNTMPGFTSISMYPKLMESIGIPFAELCDRLISLAMAGHPDGESHGAVPEPKEREMSAGQ